MIQPPNILTIAGSDSGGGAGIQADLKTMTAMGAFGMSVITALTAQNGLGVTGIHAPEPEFAALQLRTILDGEDFPLVVDPVCVSTSGHKLMEDDGIAALRERLFSRASLLTPNRPEAETFTGVNIKTDDDAIEAGTRLLDMGVKAVLMKGGHVEGKPVFVTDWLLEQGREPVALRQPHVDTQNSHGTGCTLSAAIATQLGFGLPLRIAVTKAQEFLNLALRHSYAPGKGFGPVNHMAGLKK